MKEQDTPNSQATEAEKNEGQSVQPTGQNATSEKKVEHAKKTIEPNNERSGGTDMPKKPNGPETKERPVQVRHTKPRQDRPYKPGPKTFDPKKPLEERSLGELIAYARRFGIIGSSLMRKDELIKKIQHTEAHPEKEIEVEGVLEKLPDGFGFLRSPKFDYISGPDDIYVSPSQIRRFGLKTGDTVTGIIRKPKEGEKYFALLKINKINYEDPAKVGDRMPFERL